MSTQDAAIRLLAHRNFHQCFWLPANENHGRLRVTYATSTNFDQAELPAVLFIGPMFGSRYFCTELNQLGTETGVRFICFDRPGFGGSTPVPIEQRINVWLETVPALLQRLNVEHVSLVSHSAGTLYCLNTLFHLRHMLDPQRPYVAMLAPWVSQVHSGVTMLSLASKLPNAAFSGWSGIIGFVNNNIAPVTSWSGGIISSAASLFQGAPNANETPSAKTARRKWGTDVETAAKLDALQGKYCWAEDRTGANDEARLCLGGGKGLWGACEDYDVYVQHFCAAEEERKKSNDAAGKLQLRVFFAESDIMIGTGGKTYYEKVWKQECVASCIDIEMVQLPDTNHETVLSHDKGAFRTVFKAVGRSA